MSEALRRVNLVVDGVRFGRYVAVSETSEGAKFEGTEAFRTVVGSWCARFGMGLPETLFVSSIADPLAENANPNRLI